MPRRPLLLDLCCKAGGAAQGYAAAGFAVVGVDIHPQPHYPFRFIQADALTVSLDGYDAYHASPPCQQFSRCKAMRKQEHRIYPDLVDPLRQRLLAMGKPFVMENVPGAPLRSPLILCGRMFGLKLLRHRLFESNVLLLAPGGCSHVGLQGRRDFYTVVGHISSKAEASAAMGIDWMTSAELAQAIPPAYTAYVGRQLIAAV